MGSLALVVGHLLMGYVCISLWSELYRQYPEKLWVKYLPMFGFSLLLTQAGEPPEYLIPGLVLILAGLLCSVFGPKVPRRVSSREDRS